MAPKRSQPRLAQSLLIHLRLPFQLLLAPVFLWGWLVAGGGWSPRLGLAFITFHVFLYGGASAYNSYYDRDEGPIGGLEHPPPVEPALLWFALAVEFVGCALTLLVNVPTFLLYVTILVIFTAYSHPSVRLKARPFASLAAVGLGQGVLAYLAGYAACSGELSAVWRPVGVLGALAAALLILGVYPLTQVFQIDEDRARGDRTVAVAWGTRTCFILALSLQAIGGIAMLLVLDSLFGSGDVLVVGLGI
ncbi:MAG: UbiA prenyltransferase family protein, partial [Chloroflexi bacterium]|nr:UbiA prenyltransferase family protein [Chloroflexota bacterium]